MLDIKIIASGSKGNATYISDDETLLLIDCGVSVPEIQEGIDYTLSKLQGCIVTHEHGDHCKAAKELRRRGVNMYLPPATSKALELKGRKVNVIKPLQYLYIGSWTIVPFPVEHDVENFGYQLESKYGAKILYITDAKYCRYKNFKDITHMMIAVNYDTETMREKIAAKEENRVKYKRVIDSHMSLETARDLIKANMNDRLEAVYLLHLSDTNSSLRKFKKEIRKTTGVPVYIGGVDV